MRRWMALPLIAVVGASGCSEDGGSDASSGTFVDLLQLVPDVETMRDQVVYGSLRRVLESGGDDTTGNAEETVGSLMEVTPAWVVAEPFRQGAATIDDEELGFDLGAIDASVQAGAPPDDISVFVGRIETEQVDEALTTFEPFADELEQDEQGGVQLYRFGEELAQNIAGRTPARPLGVGGRFAVDDSTIWRVGTDATLDAVAEVAAGDGESLADVDGFTEVAGVLDDAESYTAVMVGNPSVLRFDPVTLLGERATPEMIDEVTARFQDSALARWDVAGLGDGFAGGDPDDDELVIVLWHADEDAAEQNEAALADALAEGSSVVSNQPWAEICRDADVVRDGALVTATCSPQAPGLALDIILTRDMLLAWQ